MEGVLADKLGGKIATSLAASLDHLFPTGGIEATVAPGEKPPKNVPIREADKARIDARLAKFGLTSFRADDFREGVYANWGERFLELERELSGERQPPRGAAQQVYDENALVYPEKERFPLRLNISFQRKHL